MKTPSFWYSDNYISLLLLPISWIFNALRILRNLLAQPTRLQIPVICVGNLTAGGAGKTPVATAIGELLKTKKIKACFLSRGYGGKLSGPVFVDEQKHSAADVGDEPLLLAKTLPSIVAKNRLEGGKFAVANGMDIIIMDDGLQNLSLEKQVTLCVVDGASGFGNGYLIPAGPLREPIDEGLARCNATILINNTEALGLQQSKRVFTASTKPVNADFVRDKRWLAFCGIAHPDKFFTTLHNLGGHVLKTHPYGDHHPYTEQEIMQLKAKAEAQSAQLITTAKDLVRIPKNLRDEICVVDITLDFDDREEFKNYLLKSAGIA